MFWDRLTQRQIDAPSSPTWFGRLIVDAQSTNGHRINNQDANAGDALVPGSSGFWSCWSAEHVKPTRGRFHHGWDVDEQDAMAIRQLGDQLLNENSSWLEWSDISPLAPNLDDAANIHPLEEFINKEFAHLAEVCRHPTTHIRVESERVPVARARRLDVRAISYLASHSEDWGHRTLSGVHPHRVLAQVREEEINLYENRVAVRLIDHLVQWLQRRISQLRRVVSDVFNRLDDSSTQAAKSRRKRERMYTLWGESWNAAQGQSKAEQAIDRLQTLLFRLLGLMDSELYRQIPRQTQVSRVLRLTNLFRNDDHYRGVARLWSEWATLSNPHTETSEDRWSRLQLTHRSFAAWSMLLVARACSQLHLEPDEEQVWEQSLHPGCQVSLSRNVELRWCHDNTIEFRREEHVLVRFVPLFHAFGRSSTALAQSGTLKSEVEKGKTWTVILHPGVTNQQKDIFLEVGEPPMPTELGHLDFVQVSPFALDSVERVARAIRWATLAPRMLAYPTTINISDELPDELHSALSKLSWVALDDAQLVVTEVASEHEWQKLDIESHKRIVIEARVALEQERDELTSKLEKVRGDRRETNKLKSAKQVLLQPIENAKCIEKSVLAFANQFQQGVNLVRELAQCPVCSQLGTLTSYQNDRFEAICPNRSCSATWGLLPFENGFIPVLFPGDAEPDDLQPEDPPQRAGELWGGDVLGVHRAFWAEENT